jgi:ATP-dependent DNA ligase
MQVFKFESKSVPGTFHDTTLLDDKTATCTCNGFRDKAWCTHTIAVLETLEGKALPKPMTNINRAPVKPMLASALPDEKTIDDYHPDEWVLEEKYDGHRLILGFGGKDDIHAWSRSGLERMLPDHIHADLGRLAHGIYDCEQIVHGGTATDVRDLGKQGGIRLVVFDVLSVAGTAPGTKLSTIEYTQSYRRGVLQKLFADHEADAPIILAPQSRPSREALEAIWARGGEGAILKQLDAIYQPTKRSKAWVKFKKFESSQLTVMGFLPGRLGPFSIIVLQDLEGVQTAVKALNNAWRERFLQLGEAAFIGKTLVISHQGRTTDSYRSPMADHFLGGME